MKKLKHRILQSMADYIIKKLEAELDYVTIDDKYFYFYYELGMWLDFYSLEYFDYELE